MITIGARFGAESSAGFAVRFAVIAASAVGLPLALSALPMAASIAWIVPASGALVLAFAYVRRPTEALLAFALIVLFYDTLARSTVREFKQLDEFAVALIALIAFARAAPRFRSWMWWPREGALVVVFTAALASTLVAGVPLRIWFPELLLVGKPIAFLYAVIWTPFRREDIRPAMQVVLAVGIAVLALGFIELLFPASFQQVFALPVFQPRGSLPVVKSVFVHPSLFGWFTAFVACFLFAMFLVTRASRWLLLAFGFSLGPILSARRRAILALGAGLLAAFLATLRERPRPRVVIRLWGPVVAGVMVLTIVFMPLFANLYQLTIDRYIGQPLPAPPVSTPGQPGEPSAENENPQARVALYMGAVRIAIDRAPLGGGLGRYASWMSRVNYSPLYAEYGLSDVRGLGPNNPRYATDTFWPQILGEFGVVGAIGYVWFLGTLGWALWRAAAKRHSPLLQAFHLGAGMIFAQALVESLANAMFHSPPRVYLVFLVVGVVISLAWHGPSATGQPEASARAS